MMADFAFRSSEEARRAKSENLKDPIKPGKPMTSRNVDDRIYDEQHEKIANRFGSKTADNANYGWGVSGDKHGSSIATKVYHEKGARVLTSEAGKGDRGAGHRWNKY